MTADELSRSKWIKSASKVSNVLLRDLIYRYSTWVNGGGVRQSLVNADASPCARSALLQIEPAQVLQRGSLRGRDANE